MWQKLRGETVTQNTKHELMQLFDLKLNSKNYKNIDLHLKYNTSPAFMLLYVSQCTTCATALAENNGHKKRSQPPSQCNRIAAQRFHVCAGLGLVFTTAAGGRRRPAWAQRFQTCAGLGLVLTTAAVGRRRPAWAPPSAPSPWCPRPARSGTCTLTGSRSCPPLLRIWLHSMLIPIQLCISAFELKTELLHGFRP